MTRENTADKMEKMNQEAITREERQLTDSTTDQSSGILSSRRRLSGIIAATGGAVGAVAWFGFGDSDLDQVFGGDTLSRDEQDQPSEDDEERSAERAAAVRSELYENRISWIPTFSYDPITEDFEGDEEVERVIAEPADDSSGDRLALLATDETTKTLKTTFIGGWGDPEATRDYETSIDGEHVTFEVSVGSDVVLGVAVRDSPTSDTSELLAVRGTSESVVEDKIDDFTQFYSKLAP